MFEELETRAGSAAARRVEARTHDLAEGLRALLPPEVSVETNEEGVLLSGPGLGHRVVLDASLRWTIAGLLR